jgi:hypothetical protein
MVQTIGERNTAFIFGWAKLKERASLLVHNIDGKERFKMYQKY